MVFSLYPMESSGAAKPSRAARVGEGDRAKGEAEWKGFLPSPPPSYTHARQFCFYLGGC